MLDASHTTGFVVNPDDVRGDHFELRGDEARHASRVLRVEPGHLISAVDGLGNWYGGTVESVGEDRVLARIESTSVGSGEPSYNLRLVVGNIKSRNRLETLVEKSVELGVSRLSVLQSARSVKSGLAAGRAQRIVRAATKQTLRSTFMSVDGPMALSRALETDLLEQRSVVVCHEKAAASAGFATVINGLEQAARLSVWIGPEGGFTDEEIDELLRGGASIASLGPRRLRAETAGIVAAAGVNLLLSGTSTEPR